MRAILVTTALIMLGTVAYAANPTATECQAMWTQASSVGNPIPQANATYISDFRAADQNGDGQLSGTEFVAACQGGLVNASRLPANQ